MFAITGGKGFQITFPNGITLSTQFGGVNYCGNRNHPIVPLGYTDYLGSENTEIAVFAGKDKTENWLTKQAYKETFDEDLDDDVKGYVKLKEWLRILDWCREYKPEKDREEENKDD